MALLQTQEKQEGNGPIDQRATRAMKILSYYRPYCLQWQNREFRTVLQYAAYCVTVSDTYNNALELWDPISKWWKWVTLAICRPAGFAVGNKKGN